MPTVEYRPRKFTARSQEKIDQAVAIIAEFEAQGYNLTLRQLYYQFVSRDLIKNCQTEYDNLGSLINDARYAGLIDWDSITDRTRNLKTVGTWDSPQEIISAVASQYAEDLWKDQPKAVEVWIEKDALVGVIEGPCNELRVPYFSCRGYTSASEMWTAGQRIIDRFVRNDQTTTILHLGDHDPSGIDMSGDIERRLTEFCDFEETEPPMVYRIALNMDQVRRYNPPPNPAKLSDGRAAKYIALHGPSSWELDALQPAVIDALIREWVERVVDADKWREARAREQEQRTMLRAVSGNWDQVRSIFGGTA